MKATAQFHVTLDVPLATQWPEGTDIATIRKEAIQDGVSRLQEILKGPGAPRIVGEPKVTIVLVEDV